MPGLHAAPGMVKGTGHPPREPPCAHGATLLSASSSSTATSAIFLVHLIALSGILQDLFNIGNALLRAFKVILQVHCLFVGVILLFCNVS